MHLEIKQANDRTEQVSSTCIDKLYNLSKNGLLDATSDLRGNINATSAYEDAVTFLNTMWGPNLIVTASTYYIRFVDPEAERLVKAALGKEQDEGVISSELSSFRPSFNGNTVIEYFDEMKYCSPNVNEYAFYNCTNLKSVDLTNITQLRGNGNYFSNCTNLEYFHGINGERGVLNLTSLNVASFINWFYNCKKLERITSLGFISNIGKQAFANCSALESVTGINNVTSIGQSAFENCVSLATIDFPSTVTSVDINAFNNTAWYNSQPDGAVVIGSCLYKYKGIAIGTYTIPSGITNVSPSCFYGQPALTGITSWPSSQMTIPNACFQNSGLTSIVIPNSVTTLGDDCFTECRNLASITIGTGITRLGRNVFSSCSSVETLVIPSNVKSLERDTLTGCKSLQWVRLESTTMVSLNNASCFNNTNNCIIYVPSDLVDTYKADSKWSSLANRIQAIPTT